MRHIWICLIDGCLIRSGPVQASETMPILLERLLKIFPHMGPHAVKVIAEDGRLFDDELWFASPTAADPKTAESDTLLAAVGVVEGHVAVKLHHGKSIEDVLNAEAGSFTGRITDDVDFGVYDFFGEQQASIEDIIAVLGPEQSGEPPQRQPGGGGVHTMGENSAGGGNNDRRRARRTPRRRVRGGAGGGGRNGKPSGRGGAQRPDGAPTPAGSEGGDAQNSRDSHSQAGESDRGESSSRDEGSRSDEGRSQERSEPREPRGEDRPPQSSGSSGPDSV